MLNIRQLKINFLLFLLALTLAGCAHIEFFFNTGKLPVETASEIQAEIGEDFNFGHLVIIDDRTGKSLLLTRSEREEDGSLRYKTEPITGPLSVKNVRRISSHSVIITEINEKNGPDAPPLCYNIGHSVCNLITIGNQTEVLCKQDGRLFDNDKKFITKSEHVFQETKTKIISVSSQLFKKLEALGKGKVKSIGFLILHDIKTGENILLKNEDYKFVNNNFVDCASKLTGSYNTNIFTFESSCSTGQTDGTGDGTTTRTRRC